MRRLNYALSLSPNDQTLVAEIGQERNYEDFRGKDDSALDWTTLVVHYRSSGNNFQVRHFGQPCDQLLDHSVCEIFVSWVRGDVR